MNLKVRNNPHESKILRFNDLSKDNPKIIEAESSRVYKEPRILGIEDHSKRKFIKKIIEKGKSF